MFGLWDAIFSPNQFIINSFFCLFCLVPSVLGVFFLPKSAISHTVALLLTLLPFDCSHISCSSTAPCHFPLFMGSLFYSFSCLKCFHCLVFLPLFPQYSLSSVNMDCLDMVQFSWLWCLGEWGNFLEWACCVAFNITIQLNSVPAVFQFNASRLAVDLHV